MSPGPLQLRTVLHAFLVLFGLVLLAVYVGFQARFLIIGPRLTLAPTPTVAQSERTVVLSGTAFNIARIWLNDRQIFTDPSGYFAETIVLENGYTIATIRAEDRYGRTTQIAQPLIYRPMSRTEG